MSDRSQPMGEPLFQDQSGNQGPIMMVQEGMRVVDAAGQELGQVENVKFGQPEAATTQGSTAPPRDIITEIAASVFGGVDVPEPKRSQLMRLGFIRVDGAGLSDTDRFVRADYIGSVSNGMVRLNVTADQMLTEG